MADIFDDPEPPDYETPPPSDPPSDGTGETPSGTQGSPGYPTPANVSKSVVSIDQNAHTVTYRFNGSYSNNTGGLAVTRRFRVYLDGGTAIYNPGFGGGTQTSATFNSGTPGDPSLQADNNQYSWKAGLSTPDYGNAFAALLYFKTDAVTAVANAPTTDAITSSSVNVTATCYPNTLHSVATLQLQYKRTVDSTWTNLGASAATSGYSLRSIGRTLSGLTPSTSYDLRLVITRTTNNETTATSSTTTFSTAAAAPTVSASDATGISSYGATLNGSVTANSLSCSVTFQYGTSPGIYSTETSPAQSASGTSPTAVSATLSALNASTTYYFRVKCVYSGTASGTEYSSERSFTTSAAPLVPEIFSSAATGITATTAELNGSVHPHAIATSWGFQWLTQAAYLATGWTTATTVAVGSGSGNALQSIATTLTGLTANTQYRFRAYATYSSTTIYGSELNFTSDQTPSQESSYDDQSHIFEFNERKKAVAATVYFAVRQPGFLGGTDFGISSDRFYNAASPFVTGDVKISKDGAAFANTSNLPARIGTSPVFSLTLTAAEMDADIIHITLIDQTATPVFRDTLICIRTKVDTQTVDIAGNHIVGGNLAVTGNHAVGGDLDVTGSIDAETNLDVGGDVLVGDDVTITGDVTAAAATFNTFSANPISGTFTRMISRTGYARAGAGNNEIQLDNQAAGTDDWYNGQLIMLAAGTGVGQCRLITDYEGDDQTCTVNADWEVNPDATTIFIITPYMDMWLSGAGTELQSLPTGTSPYAQLLQFLFNRFAYKRTLTADTMTMFDRQRRAQFTGPVSDVDEEQTRGPFS